MQTIMGGFSAVWNWLTSIWSGGLRGFFEFIGVIATPCSIVWGVIKWLDSHRPPIDIRKYPSSRGVILVFELSQRVMVDMSDDMKHLPSMKYLETPIVKAAPLPNYGQYNMTKGCFRSEYMKEYGRVIRIETTKTKNNKLYVPLDKEKTAAHTVSCFISMLNDIGTKLKAAGVKDIYLFYSGPACLSCYIGELTKNSMTLFNYYRDREMQHYVLLDKLEHAEDAQPTAE